MTSGQRWIGFEASASHHERRLTTEGGSAVKGRRLIPLAATAALAAGATFAVTPSAHADWLGTITGKVLNADGSPNTDCNLEAVGVDDGNANTYDGGTRYP